MRPSVAPDGKTRGRARTMPDPDPVHCERTTMKQAWIRAAAAAGTLALTLGGCSTTQQVKLSDRSSIYCPFLGDDVCAKLKAADAPGRFSSAAVTGADSVIALRYINPDARWTDYKKIIIAPVGF